ncbi:hypothetical protein EVAR_36455_1 [Eumeta japonica]|uniref:Uncharacterized protein n=1 Tax=Eumeta variegata TaxID=151549 RepID=A0A4C1VRB7_EUMVA|nr:hypothetical protein EVAR_36455_1 [Eumeta japonica]
MKLCRCEIGHESGASAQNTNVGEKGSGSVIPAHCIFRKQFRAAVSCVVLQVDWGMLTCVITDATTSVVDGLKRSPRCREKPRTEWLQFEYNIKTKTQTRVVMTPITPTWIRPCPELTIVF